MVALGRVRLGDMLVEAQLLSREQLEGVLALQRRDGRRVGALLVETGLISEVQLTQLLSQQLSVPWVSLYHIDFSRKLLELVSRPLAEQNCLIPVFVRRVRGIGRVLYIAMDDPGDEDAKLAVAEYSGLPVRAMIAPPSDIRAAIRAYYGGAEAESDAASLPPAGFEHGRETIPDPIPAMALTEFEPELRTTMPSMPPDATEDDGSSPGQAASPVTEASALSAASAEERVEAPARPPGLAAALGVSRGAPPAPGAARAPAGSDGAEGNVSPRASDLPPPRRGSATKGVTLTLLDGTEVVLPARRTGGESGAPAPSGHLTARDLIQALMASGQGADASEVFGGTPRWEHVAAATLSVLLKKHLIADWEFAEEYRRLSQGR